MVARVIPVDPFDLVIFGGTGDLARRKILPALCRRFADGQMPEGSRIIGAARAALWPAGSRRRQARCGARARSAPARAIPIPKYIHKNWAQIWIRIRDGSGTEGIPK